MHEPLHTAIIAVVALVLLAIAATHWDLYNHEYPGDDLVVPRR